MWSSSGSGGRGRGGRGRRNGRGDSEDPWTWGKDVGDYREVLRRRLPAAREAGAMQNRDCLINRTHSNKPTAGHIKDLRYETYNVGGRAIHCLAVVVTQTNDVYKYEIAESGSTPTYQEAIDELWRETFRGFFRAINPRVNITPPQREG